MQLLCCGTLAGYLIFMKLWQFNVVQWYGDLRSLIIARHIPYLLLLLDLSNLPFKNRTQWIYCIDWCDLHYSFIMSLLLAHITIILLDSDRIKNGLVTAALINRCTIMKDLIILRSLNWQSIIIQAFINSSLILALATSYAPVISWGNVSHHLLSIAVWV